MGCASSKPPSKDKKSKNTPNKTNQKKSQSSEIITQNLNDQNLPNSIKSDSLNLNNLNADLGQLNDSHKLNIPIQIDQDLVVQIEQNLQRVIEYIVRIVHRDLNAEIIKPNTAPSANLASVVLAAALAQNNDDLINDIVSKAFILIRGPNAPKTYKELNTSLKQAQYLFKNQSQKNRICDLTVDTIKQCLETINDETCKFDLVEFLNQHDPAYNQLTPPQTPETNKIVNMPNQSTPNNWDNALLLTRAQANEVARILFLSNRARPVVHASPKAKDAYFVNKQLGDNTEVTVSRDEIDEILNRFDDQPKYIELVENLGSIQLSPISPQLSKSHGILKNNLDDTPLLSTENRPSSNLLGHFNDLNQTNQTENDNEDFTTVTQEINNETIQFVSNLNDTQNDNLEESTESDVGDSVLGAMKALARLTSAVKDEHESNEQDVKTITFTTKTIITTTTLTKTCLENVISEDENTDLIGACV